MPKLIGLLVKFQIRSAWLNKNHYSLCIHLGTQDPFALPSKPINVGFLFQKTVNTVESEDSSAPADRHTDFILSAIMTFVPTTLFSFWALA